MVQQLTGRRARTRETADRSLRVVRVPAAVLVAVYLLSLLALAVGDSGVLAALAVGGKWSFVVGLTGLLVLRAVLRRLAHGSCSFVLAVRTGARRAPP